MRKLRKMRPHCTLSLISIVCNYLLSSVLSWRMVRPQIWNRDSKVSRSNTWSISKAKKRDTIVIAVVIQTVHGGNVPEYHLATSHADHHHTFTVNADVTDWFFMFFDIPTRRPACFIPKSNCTIVKTQNQKTTVDAANNVDDSLAVFWLLGLGTWITINRSELLIISSDQYIPSCYCHTSQWILSIDP